ncbi:hypothetical protein K1719_013895 [Acacia pycnantha]|nr:hypothetical protein K1719_013895 [Acacia pycnantha]
MVSLSVHLALVLFMVFTSPPLFSSASQPNTKVSILYSSEAALADPPLSSVSSLQELSPDIAPLLPSNGGVSPIPTGSDTTTIPSSPSPPNPDDTFAPGPLSAFSPFGLLQASSNVPKSMVSSSVMVVFAGLAVFLV